MRRTTVLVFVLAVLIAAASCSKKSVPSIDISTRVEIVSGNNQTVAAGDRLADSLLVRVVDSKGYPVSGITVTFTQITDYAGSSFLWDDRVTNDSGYVRNFFDADSLVGVDTLAAIASGVDDSIAYISVTVIAGEPILKLVSGNNQTTDAGQALPQPCVVKTVDQYGNPVADQRIMFKTFSRCLVVTDSTALLPFEVDSAFTRTDANGLAQTTWLLSLDSIAFIGYPNSFNLLAAGAGDTVEFSGISERPDTLTYYGDIRPIFEDNCFICHPSALVNYRLDIYDSLFSPGSDAVPNLIPGDSTSLLAQNARAAHKASPINMIEEDKVFYWIVIHRAKEGAAPSFSPVGRISSMYETACLPAHR